MSESIHKKVGRVRPPRVHITYEVETEGAVRVQEVPFVVGVMGDFSGNPTEALPPLSDRKFIPIDRDNFDEVMARMRPELNLRVENTVANDGSEFGVKLNFKSMEDFEPAKIVDQVPMLKKILETRNKLRDLLTLADQDQKLEDALADVLANTENLQALAGQLPAPPAEPKKEGE